MLNLILLGDGFGKILSKRGLFKNFTQEIITAKCGLLGLNSSELEMDKKDRVLLTIFKLASALKIKPSILMNEVVRLF